MLSRMRYREGNRYRGGLGCHCASHSPLALNSHFPELGEALFPPEIVGSGYLNEKSMRDMQTLIKIRTPFHCGLQREVACRYGTKIAY